MCSFLRKYRSMIGIYTNEESIILCQTSVHRKYISIDKVVSTDGNFDIEKIFLQIDRLVKKYDFNTNRVNISLPGKSLVKSYLDLPYMEPEQTLQYIKYEFHRLYGIDSHLYDFSFYTLEIKPDSRHYIQTILAFGAPKDLIKLYGVELRNIGLKPNSFILPIEAQLTILKNIDANINKGKDTICLVYIEKNDIDIFFYYEQNIRSIASISVLKRDINELSNEIKRVFNYFHIKNYDKDISAIVLSGDCRNMAEYLELFAQFGYRTMWLNNEILGFESNLDKEVPFLAPYIIAIGASLYH